MRRNRVLILFAPVVLMAAVVIAQNPHFMRATANLIGTNLEVCFKIAGLGSNVTTTVTASANATALYACRNNGGNFPSDPKKEEVTGPVSASGQFTSGKNGQITDCLTVGPPVSTLSCPPGQTRFLCSLTRSRYPSAVRVANPFRELSRSPIPLVRISLGLDADLDSDEPGPAKFFHS